MYLCLYRDFCFVYAVLKSIELSNVMKGKNFEEYIKEMKEKFNELGWNFLSVSYQ